MRAPSPSRRRSSASLTASSGSTAADDSGEVEIARECELGEARQVGCCVSRAVVRAADPLVGEELDRRKRDVDAFGRESDDDCGSAGPQAVPGEAHRLRAPDDLERVVGAAAGQPRHARGGRRRAGLDRVRRSARKRELELRRVEVDRDDRIGAGEAERRDDLEADAAASDDDSRLAGCTRAAFRTAPKAVTTPQPRSEACHSGSSRGSGTAPAAGTTVRSAKQAVMSPCWSGVPSGSESRDVPSMRTPRGPFSPAGMQRWKRPARHSAHVRHAGTMQKPT